MNLDGHELVLVGVLLLIVLFILRSLEIRSKSRQSQFFVDDLLIGPDGKASKAAIVMFGSFVLTSWVIIFQTLSKTLTDLTFAAYVTAWVVPAVTNAITNQTQPLGKDSK